MSAGAVAGAGRTLVMGWFSFEGMGVTAGHLMARDLVCEWLAQAGRPHDVATTAWTGPGVDWRSVDPARYAHLVFVCGPFAASVTQPFLDRFAHCRRIGINLSMLHALDQWNPFDVLFERDSSAAARADITFLAPSTLVPVVGLVLVPPQPEYGRRARHARAHDVIGQLRGSRPMAAVPIDTRIENNRGQLSSPDEIETLIARMDVVVTTRLHGLVLALRNGVPAVAVDPVLGGAKITRQAAHIGWPVLVNAESVTLEELQDAFDFCLTDEARSLAEECRDRARAEVQELRREIVAAFEADGPIGPRLDPPTGSSSRRPARTFWQAILRLIGG